MLLELAEVANWDPGAQEPGSRRGLTRRPEGAGSVDLRASGLVATWLAVPVLLLLSVKEDETGTVVL